MSAYEADYPAAHSMDTEWFAVDGEGQVAVFRTGEEGPLPEGQGGVGEAVEESFIERLCLYPGDLAFGLSDSGADDAVYQIKWRAPADLSSGEKMTVGEVRRKRDVSALLLLASEEALAFLGPEGNWSRLPARDQILVRGEFDFGLVADLWESGYLRKGWLGVQLDSVRFGMFTYEYDRYGHPKWAYERVGVPRRPIRLADIPAEVRDAVTFTSLPAVDFSKEAQIQVLDHVVCQDWGGETLTQDDGVATAETSPAARSGTLHPLLTALILGSLLALMRILLP